ncbi:MAG TPA: L-rhamnose mutarotase [Planctomycetota bacterium]|nr:L-rhamnose mutarotase [Planctomycetota bacterium]
MVRRFGQVLGIRPECFDAYRRHHANVWPEIAHALRDAGVRNYSIFHQGGQLFGYFEYVGPESELEARMQRLAAAPRMREWWDLMEPMQIARADRAPGEWWTTMSEVFHLD